MFTKKSLVSGVLATAMLLGVGSSVSPVGAVNQKPDDGKNVNHPVFDIYLHGFLGDQDSLSTMIRNVTGAKLKGMSKKYKLKYSGQKGTFISREDRIDYTEYSAYYKEKHKRTAFDVYFMDNRNSVESQYEDIRLIVNSLTKSGARVNLIGHSMGGLAATSYATHYDGNFYMPKVNKLVTLGSPITGAPPANLQDFVFLVSPVAMLYRTFEFLNYTPTYAKEDLKVGSYATRDVFKNGERKINPKTKVYSVYGGVSTSKGYKDTSDGVVPKESALYLKKKVKAENFKSYYAKGVGHTKLMHDKKVASKVAEWLK